MVSGVLESDETSGKQAERSGKGKVRMKPDKLTTYTSGRRVRVCKPCMCRETIIARSGQLLGLCARENIAKKLGSKVLREGFKTQPYPAL